MANVSQRSVSNYTVGKRVLHSGYDRLRGKYSPGPVVDGVRGVLALGRVHHTVLTMVSEGRIGWSTDIGISGGFLLDGKPFQPCPDLVALHELRCRRMLLVDVESCVVGLEPAGREILEG